MSEQLFDNSTVKRSALIEGPYRYWLERRWAEGPAVLFIMLNPSTADAEKDDPTIRRCMGFARSWGKPAIQVYNLYAFRATEPMKVFEAADPVGPDNDRGLFRVAKYAGLIIAAWGTLARNGRDRDVMGMLGYLGCKVFCLEKTKEGHPKHPLYVRASVQPQPFVLEGGA